MNEYMYLILTEVDESPFLVLADKAPPEDGFVTFDDGTGMQVGRIVEACFLDMNGTEYSMFAAMHPIFEAVKMYGCCYEKEEHHDGS